MDSRCHLRGLAGGSRGRVRGRGFVAGARTRCFTLVTKRMQLMSISASSLMRSGRTFSPTLTGVGKDGAPSAFPAPPRPRVELLAKRLTSGLALDVVCLGRRFTRKTVLGRGSSTCTLRIWTPSVFVARCCSPTTAAAATAVVAAVSASSSASTEVHSPSAGSLRHVPLLVAFHLAYKPSNVIARIEGSLPRWAVASLRFFS
mmetsp:Transcript_33872/g.82098  ORF Transcript_33872/g.82098 Transcript_33872/m.82098 type:complete len:202 (-) Transcript_33872:1885-2490(-)